eukprot:5247810-Amphidinium_carterae.1
MDMPAETQRMILSSAGCYDIDRLMLSIELHFGGSLPPCKACKGKGKGKDKGKPKGHAAHVTDASGAEHEQTPDQDTAAPGAEPAEEAEQWPELTEVAEALSVTAQKLRHLTQSRGWYQPGKGAVTTTLAAPPASRWDSITSGNANRTAPPHPPPADPRRVHATAWEQAVDEYAAEPLEPVSELEPPAESWDQLDYELPEDQSWYGYMTIAESGSVPLPVHTAAGCHEWRALMPADSGTPNYARTLAIPSRALHV